MDDTPILLPATFLKRSGLFKDDPSPFAMSFNIPRAHIAIARYGKVILIEQTLGHGASIEIEWTTSQLKHGERPYFLDEEGYRFAEVIFWRGVFYPGNEFYGWKEGYSISELRKLTAPAKRLHSYWIPAGASKRKITEVVRRARSNLSEGQIERLPAETINHVDQARKSDIKSIEQKRWTHRANGPLYAIKAGAAPAENLHPFLMKTTPAEYRQRCPLPLAIPDLAPGQIDICHKITTKTLEDAGLLNKGELTPFLLGWELNEAIREGIMVVGDLRDRDYPMVLFEFSSNDNPEGYWQRVTIEYHRNKRWYFRCPVTDRRCESLYLRNGLFASNQAQSLYPPSHYDQALRAWQS